MNRTELKQKIEQQWPDMPCHVDKALLNFEIRCTRATLAELCGKLFLEWSLSFAGLIVEEGANDWQLRYCFYGERNAGWVHVLLNVPLNEPSVPTIVKQVCAVDWHEREAEDLFGLQFEGHPRLGDFVIHDDAWQENVEPMRRHFDSQAAMQLRKPTPDWRPRRILEETGAFVMPVGPKFSGVTEPVHFLLETVGEDVTRSIPRLFFKWRAVEKLAEGKTVAEVLLLAERFAATTAFAHGLAYCQAIENICGVTIPKRAQDLRIFLAELERLRQHAGAIQEICESTALVVANSLAGILEEDLLRISCELAGHRYLFGLLAPGGILCDLPTDACAQALKKSQSVLKLLNALDKNLRVSSSFLDRLEEVGFISLPNATIYGLLGPIARASGLVRDLRRAQPYLGYGDFEFDVPSEKEGDGYARLRVLFAEANQSVRIMEQVVARLENGDVCESFPFRPGAALGWVEAPRGGSFHWVRLDEHGRIARYRIVPPSFANWHGFHLAVEKFAFQDFPIILSTFDLSVAESDR
jgi:formate hydrogenlyase subunit 5